MIENSENMAVVGCGINSFIGKIESIHLDNMDANNQRYLTLIDAVTVRTITMMDQRGPSEITSLAPFHYNSFKPLPKLIVRFDYYYLLKDLDEDTRQSYLGAYEQLIKYFAESKREYDAKKAGLCIATPNTISNLNKMAIKNQINPAELAHKIKGGN
jgi:hypothetical protein